MNVTNLKLSYIRVTQRGQSFFLAKASAYDLRERVDFHFREPYMDLDRFQPQGFGSVKRSLEESGATINAEPGGGGVQRRLSYERVRDIRDFVSDDPTALLPSSVLLAIDTSHCADGTPEMDETGVFALSEDMHVSVIDGQHRLAGVFLADDDVLREIELPVVFMIDVDTPTAARLFQQINGKQKPVSKSVIFDLFDCVPDDEITREDDRLTKDYHTICKALYTDSASPLFRQIKMLGTGGGAVSQAFFIDTCKRHLGFMENWPLQDRYDVLYGYFRAFQGLFPQDWPVPRGSESMSFEALDAWAHDVLKVRKSQLPKTNGFAAIVHLLRHLHEVGAPLSSVDLLVGRIDWTSVNGTGDGAQQKLYERLKIIMDEGFAFERERRAQIAELVDVIGPNVGQDEGYDGMVYGNYCEWPILDSLDDETLFAAARAVGLNAGGGDVGRDGLIALLRNAGVPEGIVYEDSGAMRLYPPEMRYWHDE